jgi:hypothetical protein
METHQKVDKRSFILAQAIADKIEKHSLYDEIEKAKQRCIKWYNVHKLVSIKEWINILKKPWAEIKTALLEKSEAGQRLRQNNPFCGVLSNKERWNIYRRFKESEKRAS